MLTLEEIKKNKSKNIEFKEVIPQDYKKFLKTVVAYSNCAGGKIIFGIQDGTLKVIGIKDNIHKTIDRLTNIISDSITPQIISNIYVENAELIEHWGTGIARVLCLCKEIGIKEPEFIDMGDAIRVNIYRPSFVEPINEPINNELSSNAQKVLIQIKIHLSANLDELTKLCGFSLSTVRRTLNELTEKGYLLGKTSNKSGNWLINDK